MKNSSNVYSLRWESNKEVEKELSTEQGHDKEQGQIELGHFNGLALELVRDIEYI